MKFAHENLLISSLVFGRIDNNLVDFESCVFDNVTAGSVGFVDNIAISGNTDYNMTGDPNLIRLLEDTVKGNFDTENGAQYNWFSYFKRDGQMNNSRIEIAWTNLPASDEFSLFS